ncbi:hypothetical protein GCM10017786_64660 [Amycolatopsis deserti]|uniref:Uncharacterized protein n=1 Tax=Amycolatopsis deserti TaxID=185696 RepID=A0ABQ3JG01_9PSEU|nr:hypothetical protein GCM10017786_64660 [Amycolatopsis deserti]
MLAVQTVVFAIGAFIGLKPVTSLAVEVRTTASVPSSQDVWVRGDVVPC